LTLRFHRAANPGEALQAIAAGEGDVHPHLSPSAARRATVQFTDPIDTIRIALYTRAARPGQARLDDLSGMRLGFTAGSINAQVARDFPEAVHVPYADSERLFFALARGDINAALYPSRAFRELSRLLGTAGHYTSIGAPVREIPLALAVSNRRPALRDELDRALRSLRASPAFAAIRTKWFGPDESTRSRDEILRLATIVMALTLLISLAAILWTRERARSQLIVQSRAFGREQQALANDLAERNATLDRRTREMEELLYVVSHDLNSPLVSLSGFSRRARRALVTGHTEDATAALMRVERNVGHMTRLIEAVLSLARVNTGSAPVRRVALGEVFEDVALSLSGRITAAQATLTLPKATPNVICDPIQIHQAVQNLVENAVHYGCSGPVAERQITILVEEAQGQLHIGVRDRGPGLAPELQEKIFGLFQTGGQQNQEPSSGSGIGLATVRKIAARHGGSAWVASVPGQGATFWFSLAADALAQPPAIPASRGHPAAEEAPHAPSRRRAQV
ncbi:MAG: ATP-binding protein, partial [Pseudomonadota bacterium]